MLVALGSHGPMAAFNDPISLAHSHSPNLLSLGSSSSLLHLQTAYIVILVFALLSKIASISNSKECYCAQKKAGRQTGTKLHPEHCSRPFPIAAPSTRVNVKSSQGNQTNQPLTRHSREVRPARVLCSRRSTKKKNSFGQIQIRSTFWFSFTSQQNLAR